MRRRSNRFPALLVAAVFLFAGCLGSTGDRQGGDGAAWAVDADSAGVIGQVITTEMLPVEGATVTIGTFPPVFTNEVGMFAVRGLPPGTYDVVATAVSHSMDERSVRLEAGKVLDLQFVLDRLAGQDPYAQVINMRGFSFCDIILYTNWQTEAEEACDQFLGGGMAGGNKENKFDIEVLESWRYVVSEITWRATTGAGADSMRIVHAPEGREVCSGGAPCYGVVVGQEEYAKMEGEPGKTEVALYYDAWGAGTWLPYPNETHTMRVFVQWTGMLRKETAYSCELWMRGTGTGSWHKAYCWGAGVSTGIPFDLWVTIFHWQPPAKVLPCCPATDYSAVEDH